MSNSFDVIVIGAGPGGYVAAIRCAQLGMSVACVEKRKTLGGTCLNVGCIPSKALLHSSEKFEDAAVHFSGIGIKTGKLELDLKTMMKFKDGVVDTNVKGIDYLFKKNKITRLEGTGEIAAPGKVRVGKETYGAKNIIIATGSDVITLPGITIDEKQIVSSTGALELPAVPTSLIVIGGGVIGLELGTVWRRLGASVTVVEYLDNILPGMDMEIRKEALKIFKKQGIEFKLSSKVTGAKTSKKGVDLTVEPAAGGKAETLSAEIVLMAIGRKAYTDGLGLDAVGVARDERGRIAVDSHFETNVKGIFAIGDVIAGPMLAHKAEDEGVILAEILAGQSGHIDYNLVPGVVYTWPEVANVGQTEEQLKAVGVEYKAGKFPFMANGRARAMGMTEGFVKILSCSKTDRVLGAHMIGPNVGELMAEVVSVMEFQGTAEDIARTCHSHPTLSEVVKEAALAVHKRPIHL
ncbi:MAG: dihydrolipoyl dehydrogenase [Alphaproteobacteria bacterium]|nr:dihydrolipoyl dehydrogenase [Alphaproteobacteria bacterium]MBP7759695.1 dihydrolipoyl dehydrogenase [Alphaproteobacteria bacterium]MBP7762856.1 dihydrolipoyl dehydrogenase [Alphaproteobacteria bacterium]MBP7905055.1 dihydrolipoyl dehydrogenase [Alphaproteobacteria bacterium]